jgi:hypothetical protein
VQAQTLDGRSVNLNSLKGQWLLVSTRGLRAALSGTSLPAAPARETLGRERTGWTGSGSSTISSPCLKNPACCRAGHNGARAGCSHRQAKPEAGHALDEHLYVVDPQGHWMMRFPASMDKATAGKAKRDLERLLRASASWDEAGRATADAQK